MRRTIVLPGIALIVLAAAAALTPTTSYDTIATVPTTTIHVEAEDVTPDWELAQAAWSQHLAQQEADRQAWYAAVAAAERARAEAAAEAAEERQTVVAAAATEAVPTPEPEPAPEPEPPVEGSGDRWGSTGTVNGYPCGGALPTCRVLSCESGGNPYAENPSSSASGLWQIIDGTWNGFGGYYHAADAPWDVQNDKAAQLWAGGAGAGHWRACL